MCRWANSEVLAESTRQSVRDSHIQGPGHRFLIGFKFILIDVLHYTMYLEMKEAILSFLLCRGRK
jgi:hypothetical protein